VKDGRPIGHGVVIAGGGLAAQRGAETLRRLGYDGRIRIVGDERRPPYDRPPLSKALLAGTVDERALAFRPPSWYREQHIELLLGHRAAALEPARRLLRTTADDELRYDELLIATGSAPRRLPAAERFANVHVLRNVEDARAIRSELRGGVRLVVIGAGFVGMEVAATARGLGADVTIVEAAAAPLAALLGNGLGGWFAELHREEGVELLLSTAVSSLRGGARVEEVELGDGRRVPCDAVVVGIGVYPATSWLRGSGLAHDGVPVGPGGRTALPHVYAAGDAALPFDERLRMHVRSEHWESAARMGADAAKAMLGRPPGPRQPSSFWSDQYGLRVQYVGSTLGADEVEIDGDPAERDFAAVFCRAGAPVAGLLAGRPHALPAMRKLIFPALHPTLSRALPTDHDHGDEAVVEPRRQKA
jgi:NADPH-dependent 2,4-dienoyl-CoA reductase/sulfur reductase-like enzyme